jgi:hypothetical protein
VRLKALRLARDAAAPPPEVKPKATKKAASAAKRSPGKAGAPLAQGAPKASSGEVDPVRRRDSARKSPS